VYEEAGRLSNQLSKRTERVKLKIFKAYICLSFQ